MVDAIQSDEELPDDIRSKMSSTFDFNFIRKLLINTYYKGPIPEGEGGTGGHGLRKRGHALMGMPDSHRKSVLRKAKEVDLVKELPNGFATTPRGAELLPGLTICDDCGEQEEPALLPTGSKRNPRVAFITYCSSCNDFRERSDGDALRYGKVHRFHRDEDSLQEAVEAVESHEVELWLNDMSLNEAKDELST